VFALAAGDPEPAVRAAAVSQLSWDDSAAGLEALYRALEDPAPEVVREAIDALDIVGDEAALPHLDAIAQGHPDPEIRKLAHDAAESLR
jgi:HEAT repeat protein